MSTKNKEALISALKEAGRVVVLAIIPIAISQIERGTWDWRAIIIVGAITLLRFTDKLLHKLAPEGESGGITRF